MPRSAGRRSPGRRFRTSQGSGFFISDDGYIVTNNHVIDKGKELVVIMEDGTELDAKLIGTDKRTDLALLKVEGTDFTYVALADEKPSVGEWVVAVGNPFGLGGTVTAGIVSSLGRDIGAGPYDNFIQIDAPVNPGNSGGPLFNDRGQVIGIINMSVPTMEGLNFAIPAGHAKYVLDHLDAFAYDPANPETGYVYPDPPPRPGKHIGTGNEEE